MADSPQTSVPSDISDASITDEQLWAWIQDKNPLEREKAASYIGLSTEMVNELSRDSDAEVVAALAANPSVSAVALEVLAQMHRKDRPAYFGQTGIQKSPPHSIALALLRNPGLPEGALRELALSTALAVRMGIAKHPNTPSEILLRYAKDSPELREALLANPNLPESVRAAFQMPKPDTQIQRQQDAQNKLERPQDSTSGYLFYLVTGGLMGVLLAVLEERSMMEKALAVGGVGGVCFLFRWLYLLILEMEKDEQNPPINTNAEMPTATQAHALEEPQAHDTQTHANPAAHEDDLKP